MSLSIEDERVRKAARHLTAWHIFAKRASALDGEAKLYIAADEFTIMRNCLKVLSAEVRKLAAHERIEVGNIIGHYHAEQISQQLMDVAKGYAHVTWKVEEAAARLVHSVLTS